MLKNICYLLLVFFTSVVTAHTPEGIHLSEQEKAFIVNNPEIVIGGERQWAPFIIVNKDNTFRGINADLISAINRISGANFVIKAGVWSDLKKQALKGEIVGLNPSSKHANANFLNSTPYLKLQDIIFTTKPYSAQYRTLADFHGLTFGVQKGQKHALNLISKIKNAHIVTFEHYDELIEAVTIGKVDAMIGNLGTKYILEHFKNPFLRPTFYIKKHPIEILFSISPDYPEALSIINKSLALMSYEEKTAIEKKWLFSKKKEESTLTLTSEEKDYLRENKQFTLCVDPKWMPFENLENAEYSGIIAEFFHMFEKKLGTRFKVIPTKTWTETLQQLKDQKCDILSAVFSTPLREEYLNFTDPYIEVPIVLVTKKDHFFINDFAAIKDQKIGIVKGYAYRHFLATNFPDIEIVGVDSADDGLQKVAAGEINGYLDTLTSTAYLMQTKYIGQLTVSGKLDKKWRLSSAIMEDNPLLLSIMNKVINNLSSSDKQGVFNRHFYVEYKIQSNFNYRRFFIFLFISLIAVLFFAYHYKVITSHNNAMQAKIDIIDTNILLITTKKSGAIINVSSAFCNLTGYSNADLKGLQVTRLKYKKEDRDSNVRKTVSESGFWHGKVQVKLKGGAYFWADIKIIDSSIIQKHYSGFHLIFTDITNTKKLEKLSQTDALTQLSNRLFLDGKFEREFLRASRYHSRLSVLIVDIDLFKLVNDSYGHNVGDQVLVEFSKILKAAVRKTDCVGRWGGEEFLIICPETSIQGAFTLAEKIRINVETTDFPDVGNITCSIGVTQHKQGDLSNDLFIRADKALYQAKNEGRNKIVFYE